MTPMMVLQWDKKWVEDSGGHKERSSSDGRRLSPAQCQVLLRDQDEEYADDDHDYDDQENYDDDDVNDDKIY